MSYVIARGYRSDVRLNYKEVHPVIVQIKMVMVQGILISILCVYVIYKILNLLFIRLKLIKFCKSLPGPKQAVQTPTVNSEVCLSFTLMCCIFSFVVENLGSYVPESTQFLKNNNIFISLLIKKKTQIIKYFQCKEQK